MKNLIESAERYLEEDIRLEGFESATRKFDYDIRWSDLTPATQNLIEVEALLKHRIDEIDRIGIDTENHILGKVTIYST